MLELNRVWLGTCVNINCFGFHTGFPSVPKPNPSKKKRIARTLQKQQRTITMPREISFPTSYVKVYKDGAWVEVLPQYKSTKPPGYDDLEPSGEYGRARKAGVPATITNVQLREVTEEDVQSGRYLMHDEKIVITTTTASKPSATTATTTTKESSAPKKTVASLSAQAENAVHSLPLQPGEED
jgi:hypothetical protein